MKKFFYTSLIGIALLSHACTSTPAADGGSEFGNPTRPVTGRLTTASEGLALKSAVTDCPADTVIATDSLAQTVSASVETDCSFTLSLTVGKAYVISFSLGDVFVATLVLNNSPATLSSKTIIISEGESAIDLGMITISGKKALPESQAALQNDQDANGTSDFDDADDDGDGVPDEEEEDCDLDGFIDDYDDDISTCEDNGDDETDTARVVEVNPENDVDLDDEEEFAELNDAVRARLNCEVDQSTVTETTFTVASGTHTVACVFEFSGSGERIECGHGDDAFLPDTVYTATINGVACLDGRVVKATTWRFRTEGE